MKKQLFFFKLSLAFGLFLLPGSAMAVEVVHGTVATLSPEDNLMTVQRVDRPGTMEVAVSVPGDAELQGIASLDELAVGDTVLVSGMSVGAVLEASTVQAGEEAPAVPEYRWDQKLTRGAANLLTFPLEIPRMINNVTVEEGAGAGWTGGLGGGVIRGVLRGGAGILDIVTSPFQFPVDGRRPMIYPEFAWQEWREARGGM